MYCNLAAFVFLLSSTVPSGIAALHAFASTKKYFSLDFIHQAFNQTFISFYYSFLRCEAILGEFLRGIKKEPENVNFAHMVNILVLYSQPEGNMIVISLN